MAVETQVEDADHPSVLRVTSEIRDKHQSQTKTWKRRLKATLDEPELPEKENMALLKFLTNHHYAFCLEEGEWGETTLIQMEINTGDAQPRRQPPGRIPPAVRRAIAQLEQMQQNL